MNEENKKVIIIGLDGATFDLIKPWAKKGIMPNIERLLENGVHSNLRSVRPHCSAPAWTSFATGKNPGKHGIFDFVMPRGSLDNLIPVTSEDIKAETYYEIINANDLNCALINLPVSYPPRTEQVTITSLMTPGEEFIFPQSLENDVSELKDYRISPDPEITVKGSVKDYIEDIRELEEARFRSGKKIYMLKDWDCFFYLISGVDWIQHNVYKDLLSGKLDLHSEAIEAYRDFDRYIGWFLKNSPDNSILILMSDHGFMVRNSFFYINTWLHDQGYLTIDEGKGSSVAPTKKAKEKHKIANEMFKLSPNKKIIDILDRNPMVKNVARRVFRFAKAYLPVKIEKSVGKVNVGDSKALLTREGAWGIYLNDKRRFKDGILNNDEYHKIRRELKEKLKHLRDKSGNRVLKDVSFKEDIYSGNFVRSGPDIVFQSNSHQIIPTITNNEFWSTNHNGHSPEGIFIASGKEINQNVNINNINLTDVAPTVLHILDLPVVKDMDGRVIKEIFKRNSGPLKREIKRKKPNEKYLRQPSEEEREVVDDEKVKERLRNLGYLD